MLMIMRSVHSPMVPPEEQFSGHQVYHGHQKRLATKCGHSVHPSASLRTPWCPDCIAYVAKAKLYAAQESLIAEGGLKPAGYMRDRQWNQTRLSYEIAKKRLETCRKESQLRWEREQAWEEAHRRYEMQRVQTVVEYQSSAECPVCISLVALYPTTTPRSKIIRDVPWWEQHSAISRENSTTNSPERRRTLRREGGHRVKASQDLRDIIQEFRASKCAADVYRNTWDTRHRTESAVRRKHSLGEEAHFEPDFWDSPISGAMSLRNFQHIQDDRRMAARRARGNAPRPKLPRSSLSYSELSEEVQVDDEWIKRMKEKEERDECERRTRRVGEEVGYLYFVGAIENIEEWREDYMRSDRHLVIRNFLPNWEIWGSEDEDDDNDDEFDGLQM